MQIYWVKAKNALKHHTLPYFARRAMEILGDRLFHRYHHQYMRLRADAQTLEKQRRTPVAGVGLISIVIPVYNTKPVFLRELADSLLAQTYPNWEACLYDGCSTRQETRQALEEIAGLDQRIRVEYGAENQGIAGNSNLAMGMARGEWVGLCDHDDLLSPDCLYLSAQAIASSQPDVIYSDEDKLSENGKWHMEPHFKPDFCADTLNSSNYVCHFLLMRRTVLEQAGGFRTGYEGSQDHDLILRLAEATDRIVHLPHVMYHWRTVGTSMSNQNLARCVESSRKAVEEHIGRMGHPGHVGLHKGMLRLFYDVPHTLSATVAVLDSGDERQLRRCAEALLGTSWPSLQWLLVTADSKRAALLPGCTVVETDRPFQRYRAMNQAMAASRGDVVAFVDSSVCFSAPSWLEELLMYAQRDDVGAVTPVLANRWKHVVHGGFALGMTGIAQCRSHGLPRQYGGWHGMMQTSHNVGAVSAAAFAVRRDHWRPMVEAYQEGLGLVDWCMEANSRGLRHVITPHSWGWCSAKPLLLLGRRRHPGDCRLFEERHPDGVHSDPCYSVHFSRKKANYAIPSRREMKRVREK